MQVEKEKGSAERIERIEEVVPAMRKVRLTGHAFEPRRSQFDTEGVLFESWRRPMHAKGGSLGEEYTVPPDNMGWFNLLIIVMFMYVISAFLHSRLSFGSWMAAQGHEILGTLRRTPELLQDFLILCLFYGTFSFLPQVCIRKNWLNPNSTLAIWLQYAGLWAIYLGICLYVRFGHAQYWPFSQRIALVVEGVVLCMKSHSYIEVNRSLYNQVTHGGRGRGDFVSGAVHYLSTQCVTLPVHPSSLDVSRGMVMLQQHPGSKRYRRRKEKGRLGRSIGHEAGDSAHMDSERSVERPSEIVASSEEPSTEREGASQRDLSDGATDTGVHRLSPLAIHARRELPDPERLQRPPSIRTRSEAPYSHSEPRDGPALGSPLSSPASLRDSRYQDVYDVHRDVRHDVQPWRQFEAGVRGFGFIPTRYRERGRRYSFVPVQQASRLRTPSSSTPTHTPTRLRTEGQLDPRVWESDTDAEMQGFPRAASTVVGARTRRRSAAVLENKSAAARFRLREGPEKKRIRRHSHPLTREENRKVRRSLRKQRLTRHFPESLSGDVSWESDLPREESAEGSAEGSLDEEGFEGEELRGRTGDKRGRRGRHRSPDLDAEAGSGYVRRYGAGSYRHADEEEEEEEEGELDVFPAMADYQDDSGLYYVSNHLSVTPMPSLALASPPIRTPATAMVPPALSEAGPDEGEEPGGGGGVHAMHGLLDSRDRSYRALSARSDGYRVRSPTGFGSAMRSVRSERSVRSVRSPHAVASLQSRGLSSTESARFRWGDTGGAEEGREAGVHVDRTTGGGGMVHAPEYRPQMRPIDREDEGERERGKEARQGERVEDAVKQDVREAVEGGSDTWSPLSPASSTMTSASPTSSSSPPLLEGVSAGGRRAKLMMVHYPANVTLKDFLVYSLAPTLIYAPNFPKTCAVSYLYVLEKLLLAIGLVLTTIFIYGSYVKPVLENLPNLYIIDAVSQLVLPLTCLVMTIFYLTFE